MKMAGDPRHMSLRPDMVDYANNHAGRSDLVAFSNVRKANNGSAMATLMSVCGLAKSQDLSYSTWDIGI